MFLSFFYLPWFMSVAFQLLSISIDILEEQKWKNKKWTIETTCSDVVNFLLLSYPLSSFASSCATRWFLSLEFFMQLHSFPVLGIDAADPEFQRLVREDPMTKSQKFTLKLYEARWVKIMWVAIVHIFAVVRSDLSGVSYHFTNLLAFFEYRTSWLMPTKKSDKNCPSLCPFCWWISCCRLLHWLTFLVCDCLFAVWDSLDNAHVPLASHSSAFRVSPPPC